MRTPLRAYNDWAAEKGGGVTTRFFLLMPAAILLTLAFIADHFSDFLGASLFFAAFAWMAYTAVTALILWKRDVGGAVGQAFFRKTDG